jgi:hypothetical protein
MAAFGAAFSRARTGQSHDSAMVTMVSAHATASSRSAKSRLAARPVGGTTSERAKNVETPATSAPQMMSGVGVRWSARGCDLRSRTVYTTARCERRRREPAQDEPARDSVPLGRAESPNRSGLGRSRVGGQRREPPLQETTCLRTQNWPAERDGQLQRVGAPLDTCPWRS